MIFVICGQERCHCEFVSLGNGLIKTSSDRRGLAFNQHGKQFKFFGVE